MKMLEKALLYENKRLYFKFKRTIFFNLFKSAHNMVNGLYVMNFCAEIVEIATMK